MKYIIPLILVSLVVGYPQFNEQQEIFAFYEKKSFNPLLHVYYDRHFKNSKQFQNFEIVLNELNEDIKDYAEIIFTNCNKNTDQKLATCNQMKKTKDNRKILGAYPSTDFKTIGNLVIQSPPKNIQLKHESDIYNKQELQNFVNGLLPNFYKELQNKEEYEEFLKPYYVPKVVLFNRDQEDIPLTMKKISSHFHLRFDFGMVGDLTEDLIPSVFDVTKFPSLMLIRYDFDTKQNIIEKFEGDLSQNSYYKVKNFLEPYALKDQRNDLIFHKIFMEETTEIKNAETEGQYHKILERANGWILIQKSKSSHSQKLAQYQKQYDRFFEYVHYRTDDQTSPSNTFLYNPGLNKEFPVDGDQLQFSKLSFEQLKSNLTVWLHKDFVVIGMRQKYSHYCSISQKNIFRGQTKCLILQEQGYEELAKFMNTQFEIGFISYTLFDEKENRKMPKGSHITEAGYETTYKSIEYATRMKLREVLYDFLRNPISQVKINQTPLNQACYHPTKKCFFLFTDLSKKDRTIQAYIYEIAINYLESYQFFEVDINSNPNLSSQFGIGTKADLVIYNPRNGEYSRLNKKVTKGLIDKFLKANRQNDKRLKKELVSNKQININRLSMGQKNTKNEDL